MHNNPERYDSMADKMTPEQRRKTMSSIRAVSKLESIVASELWKKGYRFRRNTRGMVGTPDISIKKYKVVIFIDSCFWHQCPIHGKMPKTNVEFWEKKFTRNKERDEEVNQYYRDKGWNLKRIWEHEVRKSLDKVTNEISEFIETAKNN